MPRQGAQTRDIPWFQQRMPRVRHTLAVFGRSACPSVARPRWPDPGRCPDPGSLAGSWPAAGSARDPGQMLASRAFVTPRSAASRVPIGSWPDPGQMLATRAFVTPRSAASRVPERGSSRRDRRILTNVHHPGICRHLPDQCPRDEHLARTGGRGVGGRRRVGRLDGASGGPGGASGGPGGASGVARPMAPGCPTLRVAVSHRISVNGSPHGFSSGIGDHGWIEARPTPVRDSFPSGAH